MKPIERIAAAFCVLLVLALGACGGAGGGSPSTATAGGVGTGGTGIVFGPITGFGSIVVDGTAYSSATPRYLSEGDNGETIATSAASVGLGNQVQLQLDAQGNPASVIIEPALVGGVGRIGASQFVVNGMTVRVNSNASTGPLSYFSGLSGFSSLTSGMQVAVHGAYGVDAGNQQEYVQATRIEQLPGTSTVNRLSGTVVNLNAAAGTFQLGAATVRMSESTGILPGGTVLANGLWVNVWSNTAPAANGDLRAGVIRVRSLSGTTGPVQLGGLVSRLSGTQFQVSGIAIDGGAGALAAVVRNLKSGEYVVVQGPPDARGSTLVASSVRTYAAQPAQVELKGTVTDFVNQGNFLVRGVPVDAAQAQLLGAASGAGLRNGMYVEVVGSVSGANGNLVSAASVSAPNKAPAGGTVNYRGTVSQVDAASGSFVLTGSLDEDGASVLVKLAPNVAFAKGGAAQLVNGASVEVEATKNAGDIATYGVFFKSIAALPGGPSSGKLETEGVAYGVTSSAFNVNGLTIQINGIIPQGGSLTSGAEVAVKFTQSGGRNLAQEISVDR